MKIKSLLRNSVLALTGFFLVSCSSMQPKREPGVLNITGQGGVLNTTAADAPNPRLAAAVAGGDPLGGEIAGVKLDVTKFDIPMVKNSRVEFWVKYFTGRGRDIFAQYIERYGKIAPMIIPRLKAANMPEDMIFLAMIESGFSHSARSPVGAVGPWQFMRSTGRLYGLHADWWVDERRDPIKSTEAAAHMLSALNSEYKDWQLAAAAYNGGPGRISKGIARYNTHDYWELARRRAIRPETVDYVPKMMAAAIITKNAHAFGFDPPVFETAWNETKSVALKSPEDLYTIAKFAGTEVRIIRNLNPELLRQTTPPIKGYKIRVLDQKGVDGIQAALDSGEMGKYAGFRTYAIRRGDTISKVASRFGISSEPILALNGMLSARRLQPGQQLILPMSARSPSSVRSSTAVDPETVAQNTPISAPHKLAMAKPHVLYTVKEGDTLYAISRRYEVSIQQLKQWNSLRSHKNLRPGRQLRLYVRNEQSNT